MGGVPSYKLFTILLLLLLLHTTFPLLPPGAEAAAASETLPPPSPPPPGSPRGISERGSPFKPSVVAIVAVFTTLFFLTFLLLLCVKHCKPEDDPLRNSHTTIGNTGRKNSGIDRAVIESLPIFRFGSLRGQKEGLECAVCLTRFEPVEVLRLLPKCKHAFHVECVDTWLDAHSTCPLCRYRVDPEDILLVGEAKVWPQNQPVIQEISEDPKHCTDIESGLGPDSEDRPDSNSFLRRVSGRHSSVGEKGGIFKIIFQHRISVDDSETTTQKKTAPFRMSLDSAMSTKRKRNEREIRKDGLLLTEKEKEKHKLEHRIIVSPSQKPTNSIQQRWSDVQPSELLYLTSEMIMSESCSSSGQNTQMMSLPPHGSTGENSRGGINGRSLSEITGLSRKRREEGGDREAGVVSRWLAWISHSNASVR